MGVMTCSRKRCENIMCHTYISEIGYICNECQEEFKIYLSRNKFDINDMPEGQIERELIEFMYVPKNTYTLGNSKTVDEFFQSYTRD